MGSGRPVDARVIGDANQDGNSSNDRLPGASRNSFVGPGYASADMPLSRQVFSSDRVRINFFADAFNLMNHPNLRMQATQNGFQNSAAQSVLSSKYVNFTYYPAYYQTNSNFLTPTDAYAPRQIQLGLKAAF